jgi:hypothetical protein
VSNAFFSMYLYAGVVHSSREGNKIERDRSNRLIERYFYGLVKSISFRTEDTNDMSEFLFLNSQNKKLVCFRCLSMND